MYGFHVTVTGDMEHVEKRVTEELQKEGFGVLTEIDVAAVLKKKIDVDKRPYKILGACNPVLANQAIDADPDIGLLLPCNVLIREEENGDKTVAFMDPAAVLSMVDKPGVAAMADEVKAKLMRVKEAIATM